MSTASYCVMCRTPTSGAKLCREHKGCSPAEQLRVCLARARENNLPFEMAWESAMTKIAWPHDTTHRREWKDVLASPRQMRAWGRAYEREAPATPSEMAPALLAG